MHCGGSSRDSARNRPAYRTIIIPKGVIDPNETHIIEIPPNLIKATTLIARPKDPNRVLFPENDDENVKRKKTSRTDIIMTVSSRTTAEEEETGTAKTTASNSLGFPTTSEPGKTIAIQTSKMSLAVARGRPKPQIEEDSNKNDKDGSTRLSCLPNFAKKSNPTENKCKDCQMMSTCACKSSCNCSKPTTTKSCPLSVDIVPLANSTENQLCPVLERYSKPRPRQFNSGKIKTYTVRPYQPAKERKTESRIIIIRPASNVRRTKEPYNRDYTDGLRMRQNLVEFIDQTLRMVSGSADDDDEDEDETDDDEENDNKRYSVVSKRKNHDPNCPCN